MTKPRLTAYLSAVIADQFDLACKRPGANKSAIVEKALEKYLNPERDPASDAALVRRLDRMTKQLSEVGHHQQVIVESLALFIRYYLTTTPPLPRAEQEPARALGHQRFEVFIAQVGKRLAGGQTMVSEVLDRIVAHDPDLFSRDIDETQLMPTRPGSQGKGGEAPAQQGTSAASRPPVAAPGASSESVTSHRGDDHA